MIIINSQKRRIRMETLETVGVWYVIVTLINTVIVTLWFWSVSRAAKKPMIRWKTLIVVAFLPVYIVIILTIAALIAAWICPSKGYWTNYKYYLVATVYDREHATTLFGERQLQIKNFFRSRLSRLQ